MGSTIAGDTPQLGGRQDEGKNHVQALKELHTLAIKEEGQRAANSAYDKSLAKEQDQKLKVLKEAEQARVKQEEDQCLEFEGTPETSAKEISAWLQAQPLVDRWVVLDATDIGAFSPSLESHIVQVDL